MSISIDALVDNAQVALAEYATFTQEQVDHIVRKASGTRGYLEAGDRAGHHYTMLPLKP